MHKNSLHTERSF